MIDAVPLVTQIPRASATPPQLEGYHEVVNIHADWLSRVRSHPDAVQEHRELRQRVLGQTAGWFRTAHWAQAQNLLSEFRIRPPELIHLVAVSNTNDALRRQQFLMPLLKHAILVMSAYEFMMQATREITLTKDEYIELMDEVNAVPESECIYDIEDRREKLSIMLAVMNRSNYAGIVPSLMRKYNISADDIQEFASRLYYEGLWQQEQRAPASQAA